MRIMKIAVISDTHDLFRPEVLDHLQGCDCILHGGDISSRKILEQLERIAPVRVVRGNNDKEWAEGIPLFLDFELGGLRICMAHKKKDLPKDLSPFDLVVCGHTHRYESTWIDRGAFPQGNARAPRTQASHAPRASAPPSSAGISRTLLLNPGSCGPRLLHQPITMAMIEVDKDGFICKRIEIPHTQKEAAVKIDSGNIRQQIELVIRETQKGRTTDQIAEKYGLDPKVTEQIARLYVTHPGVTADGIMTKMGL